MSEIKVKECDIPGYPKIIPYQNFKKISAQMEKNIFKIKLRWEQNDKKKQGTGFFCKIPFPDKKKLLPVLITNNHLINKEILDNNEIITIKIKGELNEIRFNLKNRIKYTSEIYDTTIIEIKEEDNINHFLKLDNKILEDITNNTDQNKEFKDESIYIIQYPEGELSVSFGILNNIYLDKKHTFTHLSSTRNGSSGSPILLINNRIIGIHKEGNNKYNSGTFLYYPIKEFIKQNYLDINSKLLKEFNEKFKCNIIDTEIGNLNLSKKLLGKEALELLCKINFKELKELNLSDNKLSDINILEKANFKKLQKLDLSNNCLNIEEIYGILNFPELKELIVNNNTTYLRGILDEDRIKENEIFEKNKKIKLRKLHLGGFFQEEIIDFLNKADLKELQELYLKDDCLSDIKRIINLNYEHLETFDLSDNRLLNIDIFAESKFKKLRILNLGNNRILNINVFEKVNFEGLEKLLLFQNYISDLNVLEKVNFKQLKILDLSDNFICNIDVLKNVKFNKLNSLLLGYNKFPFIDLLCEINFPELTHLELQNCSLSDLKILEKLNFKKLTYIGLENIIIINESDETNKEEEENDDNTNTDYDLILSNLKEKLNIFGDIKILTKKNFSEIFNLQREKDLKFQSLEFECFHNNPSIDIRELF